MKNIYMLIFGLAAVSIVIFALFPRTQKYYWTLEENSKIVPLPKRYTIYGPYDAEGIPMRDFGGDIGIVYHPLVVCEFGSYYHSLYQQTGQKTYLNGLKNMSDYLIREQDPRGFWAYHFSSNYGGVFTQKPWVSAVAQGFCVQTLLKAARVLKEERYIERARAGLEALSIDVSDAGVRFVAGSNYFFEEVPKATPTHILNGHMTALTAMAKYIDMRTDENIQRLLEKGKSALQTYLSYYDTGFWSKYDLLPPLAAHHQGLVVAVRCSACDLEGQLETSAPLRPFRFSRIDVSQYRTINGESLAADLSYFLSPIHFQSYQGELKQPDDIELVFNVTIKAAYITWKENPKILLPALRSIH